MKTVLIRLFLVAALYELKIQNYGILARLNPHVWLFANNVCTLRKMWIYKFQCSERMPVLWKEEEDGVQCSPEMLEEISLIWIKRILLSGSFEGGEGDGCFGAFASSTSLRETLSASPSPSPSASASSSESASDVGLCGPEPGSRSRTAPAWRVGCSMASSVGTEGCGGSGGRSAFCLPASFPVRELCLAGGDGCLPVGEGCLPLGEDCLTVGEVCLPFAKGVVGDLGPVWEFVLVLDELTASNWGLCWLCFCVGDDGIGEMSAVSVVLWELGDFAKEYLPSTAADCFSAFGVGLNFVSWVLLQTQTKQI